MRKLAVVPRAEKDATPSLPDRSRMHADTLSEHDGGLLPTANRPSRTQTTALIDVLRSANPLIPKDSERTNAPNAKMQGDSFLSAEGGGLPPAGDRVA